MLDAILEVRTAVVYATFAGLLVFFPVLALSGVAGRLFGPLGVAYIIAVLASLAVALTVTPALSMLLLVRRTGRQEPHEPPLVQWSRRHYEAVLRRIGRFPKLVMAAAVVLTTAGAAMLPLFGGTFLPDLREGHLILHVSAIPGTSLDESLRIGRLITDALRAMPGVRSVAQHAGRGRHRGVIFSIKTCHTSPNRPAAMGTRCGGSTRAYPHRLSGRCGRSGI